MLQLPVCPIYLLLHVETALLQSTQQAQQRPGSITTNLERENLLAAPGTNLPAVLVKRAPVVIITIITPIITITMALEVVLVEVMAVTVMAVEAMAPGEITQRLKAAWAHLEECRCLLHRPLPMEKERPTGVGIDHSLPPTVVVAVVVAVRTLQEEL